MHYINNKIKIFVLLFTILAISSLIGNDLEKNCPVKIRRAVCRLHQPMEILHFDLSENEIIYNELDTPQVGSGVIVSPEGHIVTNNHVFNFLPSLHQQNMAIYDEETRFSIMMTLILIGTESDRSWFFLGGYESQETGNPIALFGSYTTENMIAYISADDQDPQVNLPKRKFLAKPIINPINFAYIARDINMLALVSCPVDLDYVEDFADPFNTDKFLNQNGAVAGYPGSGNKGLRLTQARYSQPPFTKNLDEFINLTNHENANLDVTSLLITLDGTVGGGNSGGGWFFDEKLIGIITLKHIEENIGWAIPVTHILPYFALIKAYPKKINLPDIDDEWVDNPKNWTLDRDKTYAPIVVKDVATGLGQDVLAIVTSTNYGPSFDTIVELLQSQETSSDVLKDIYNGHWGIGLMDKGRGAIGPLKRNEKYRIRIYDMNDEILGETTFKTDKKPVSKTE